MNTIFLIARDSVRATLHHRVLLALMLVVAITTVLFSLVLSSQLDSLTAQTPAPPSSTLENPQAEGAAPDGSGNEQSEQTLQDIQQVRSQSLQGFNGFLVFGGILLAIFMGATAVSGDIRKGSIAMILSRPVTRWQYLFGKLAGIVVVLLGYSLIASAALAVFVLAHQLDVVPAIRYAPWLMFCQSLVFASVAFALSMLMHPTVAGVLTFFVRGDWFAEFFTSSNPLYYFFLFLPSYMHFDVSDQFQSGELIRGGDIVMITLYAVNVASILLLLAMWRFRTREIG